MHTSFFLVLCSAIFSFRVTALRAVPSGQCAAVCGDTTSTSSSDIVCNDSDFENTAKGQAFEACINCEMNSTAVDPVTGDTDLKWLLYNIRFTMSACLWGYPNNSNIQNTPCITGRACGDFQASIQDDSLSPNASTFDYCAQLPSSTFNTPCHTCLQQLGSDFYMSNFFQGILAACDYQSSSTLAIDGTFFSTNQVNITTPASATASSAVTVARPSGPLSLGAIIGIAVAGLLILLITAGCSIVCCGKRRRRAKLAERARRQAEYVGPWSRQVQPFGGHVETKWTPQIGGRESQDESPATAGGYGSDKHSFSPYSSRYSSPVSARDAQPPPQSWDWHQARTDRSNSTKEVYGSHDETYELEKVRTRKTQDPELDGERMRQEMIQEALQRGFTTAPIIKLPGVPGVSRDSGWKTAGI